MLSDEYHAPKCVGGHVRIYTRTELRAKLRSAGFDVTRSHHAHALHSPYWWLKCATGINRADAHPAVTKYHDFLAWQITDQPRWVNTLDRVLNPVLGKSLIVYVQKASSVPKLDAAAYPRATREVDR
jgi:hypothetical protein